MEKLEYNIKLLVYSYLQVEEIVIVDKDLLDPIIKRYSKCCYHLRNLDLDMELAFENKQTSLYLIQKSIKFSPRETLDIIDNRIHEIIIYQNISLLKILRQYINYDISHLHMSLKPVIKFKSLQYFLDLGILPTNETFELWIEEFSEYYHHQFDSDFSCNNPSIHLNDIFRVLAFLLNINLDVPDNKLIHLKSNREAWIQFAMMDPAVTDDPEILKLIDMEG